MSRRRNCRLQQGRLCTNCMQCGVCKLQDDKKCDDCCDCLDLRWVTPSRGRCVMHPLDLCDGCQEC